MKYDLFFISATLGRLLVHLLLQSPMMKKKKPPSNLSKLIMIRIPLYLLRSG